MQEFDGQDELRRIYLQQIADKDREISRLMDVLDHSFAAVSNVIKNYPRI